MPIRPAITMQEIADAVGVSRLTVSSVINYDPSKRPVSPATSKRVRNYLDKIGYVRSRQAVNLREQPRDVVGILHTGHLYSHLNAAFNELIDRFGGEPHKLELMVVTPAHTFDGIKELLGRGVSTMIWIQTEYDTPYSRKQAANYLRRMRTIFYNYHFGREPDAEDLLADGHFLVGVDREAAWQQLGNLLVELGHRTVLLPDTHPKRGGLRARLFRQCGLRVIERPRPPLPQGQLQGLSDAYAATILDLQRSEGVTAVSLHSDLIAGLVLARLRQQGLRIPQDLTLIGFDGDEMSAAYQVAMTTVQIPLDDLIAAVERIVQAEEGDQQHRLVPHLIKRESHGPAPQQQESSS